MPLIEKKKTGSRGKYAEWLTEEGLLKIEGWARDGLTHEQISQNMGIKRQTLYDWAKKYPYISDTLKRGKEVVDRQVENALFKRALGYKYDEVTRESAWDEKEQDFILKVSKVVTKEVQPDTTAQIFWLKNRKPDKWRDKQNIEHTGSMEINNPLKGLTTEELRKLIDK